MSMETVKIIEKRVAMRRGASAKADEVGQKMSRFILKRPSAVESVLKWIEKKAAATGDLDVTSGSLEDVAQRVNPG